MPDGLIPIEEHLRPDDPPNDTVLLIRGGPLAAEKLVEHALRQARDYSLRGKPMTSISVDGTVAGWTIELVLRERMWSRSRYAIATVGSVDAAGFEILPTYAAPHFDIVLADATLAEAGRLLALFGPAEQNPFKRRGRS